MTKFKSFQISTIILATFCTSVRTDSDFTYFGNMGPDHWSEHYNQCSGKHQSPININDVDVVNRNFTKMLYKEFIKLPLETSIFNNGHTVLVKMMYENEMPTIAEGPLEGKGTYQFQQLHFHWGEDNSVGSEDRINDVAYPMELHIVFRNNKYDSFEEAARKDDGVAVLAAFYEVGNYTSTEYDHFTSYLEQIHEPHTNITLTQPLDLNSLMSGLSLNDLSHYYTYIGSLTTPPCSEDVIWIDLINPIPISAELIERFRYLKTFDGSSLTHNFRPVQPLNNRQVYKSIVEMSAKNTEHPTNDISTTILPGLVLVSISVAISAIFNVNVRFN